MSDLELEALIERLRQLSLIRLETVVAGAAAEDRPELARAFADDLEDALGRAREGAEALLAAMSRGPSPLSFAGAGSAARCAADPEQREMWSRRLLERAAAARELSRLWSAAAALIPALDEADRHSP
jgi:hypothetical protein